MYSRDDVLALIRDKVHHPATARELSQLLRVPRDERNNFKRHLKTLVADGALLQIRGNRFGLPDKMDLVVGRLSTNPSGFGFVVPENAQQTEKGAEGRIIRILERSQATIVGRFEVDDSGLGYVVPFDRRVLTDVHVPTGQWGAAEPGEMVLVEITRWPTATRGPVGKVSEVLGRIEEPGVDTQIIIRKFGIPDAHSEESIEEARRIGTAVKEK